MSGTKKLLMALLLIVILGAVVLGVFWNMGHYVLVGTSFYERDAATLDLRDKDITAEHYEKLRQELPGTEILWKIPFQGRYYDQNCTEVSVTTLSEADVRTLDYFLALETVDAVGCKDYAQLRELRRRRPEVMVNYGILLGNGSYDPDAEEILLTSIAQAEIPLLAQLPNLKIVAVGGGGNMQNFEALEQYCKENGYLFRIKLGSSYVGAAAKNLELSGVEQDGLELLKFLPELETLHIHDPKAPVERLLQLQQEYPKVKITWSVSVAGKTFRCDEEIIDISDIEVTDLAEIEEKMTYFPKATQLEMNNCGVENEAMAAFREAHREDYKVVWTVHLGAKYTVRTDIDNLKPAHDATSDFHDEDAYNMRYCEDVLVVDVGHLDVRNVEWAAYMPKLKYLVISWTGVNDLTPLANCKELVFLEATDAPVGDLAPLMGCTALEDLNVSASGAKNAEALREMTWLKNLWCISRGDIGGKVREYLPDLYIRAGSGYTVAGWRSLPNYFAMRDIMGMSYMRG